MRTALLYRDTHISVYWVLGATLIASLLRTVPVLLCPLDGSGRVTPFVYQVALITGVSPQMFPYSSVVQKSKGREVLRLGLRGLLVSAYYLLRLS